MSAPVCRVCGGNEHIRDKRWTFHPCSQCNGTGHAERRVKERRVTQPNWSWDGNGYLSITEGGWKMNRRVAERRKGE